MGSPQVPPSRPYTPTSTSNMAEEAKLAERAKSMLSSFTKGDLEGFAKHYAPDARWLVDKAGILEGREGIYQSAVMMAGQLGVKSIDCEIDEAKILAPGVGFTIGFSDLKNEAGEVIAKTKELLLWQKI